MEIIERKNHGDEGEVVPFNTSEAVVQDEVNIRSWKAGYTNRQGEPMYSTKIMARGFGESKLNIWSRDENGNLIRD